MVTMAQVIRCGAGMAAVTALGAGAALVAGCGSAPQAAGQPAGSRSAPASSPAVGAGAGSPGSTVAPGADAAACATSALRISLGTPDGTGGGNATGNSYETIDFFNVSGRPCDLYGYPGVSFVTRGADATIGAPARRAGYSPVHVTVAPGGTAHAWIGIGSAQNYPAAKCRLVTAHRLRVFPPGDRAATYVDLTAGTATCSSAAATTISVDPVRAGTGVQGRMP